ncbi:MAG: hypothetical protein KDD25_02130, partial [Bdellovibrionales bacterium]|nr:hypothetical protein [Bdellovibrionales bacterium]
TAIQYFDCEKAKGHPKLQPQESWRPLNSGDYESIRNITTWFITNYRTKRKISVSEWSIFASNGFDTRDIDDLNETDESDDSDENSNVELTREEVSDIINANNQIGSLPSKCLLREGYKVIKCSTRLRIESPFQLSDKSVDRFARLSLEISGENGFVKNADLLINERTDLDRLQIEGFDQFFTVTAHPILANVKKGDDTEIYTLTFKLSRFPLTYELVGIASSRAKVVKIDDFEYSDSTCSVGLQSDDYEADFYAFSEKYTERLLEEVDVESGSSIECSRK